MRSWFRVGWVVARVALHGVCGALIIASSFRWIAPASRQRVIRWWSRRLVAMCGLRTRVVGPDPRAAAAVADALRPGHGAMLVLNHVSWVDIFVVHALRPARFVAKSEIARWPLFGYLTRRSGAIFIERGRRHAVRDANHRAGLGLRGGDLVGVFPEGTVGDGRHLLPFHANLIQAAIEARVPIVIAGLRYRDARGGQAAAMDFVGDVTMLQSLVRIARGGPIDVELHLIDAIDGASVTRHEAARLARARIAERLDLDDEARETAEGVSTVIVVPEPTFTRDDALVRTGPGTPLDPRDELL